MFAANEDAAVATAANEGAAVATIDLSDDDFEDPSGIVRSSGKFNQIPDNVYINILYINLCLIHPFMLIGHSPFSARRPTTAQVVGIYEVVALHCDNSGPQCVTHIFLVF